MLSVCYDFPAWTNPCHPTEIEAGLFINEEHKSADPCTQKADHLISKYLYSMAQALFQGKQSLCLWIQNNH